MSASMDKLAQVTLTELVVNPKNDIVDGPFGSRLKASEYVDAGIPIVRLQNIDRNQFIDKNIKFVTKAKAKEIARHHFVSGDILISKLGDPLGEACIAPQQIPYGILVADVVRVRPDKRKVDTSFLAYALNSAPVVQQFKAETKGTTRPRVNLKKIRDLRVPIVESITQQRQIVAEIEKQFTRLDAGVAALRRVQANLKRYRAAVLKAACEGRLVPTEAELAKAERRTYETGEQLLARILADRRKNGKGHGKYKEPVALDTANLPPLPEGWAWSTMAQLSFLDVGFAFKSAEFSDLGLRLLRGENIEPGRARWLDTRYWPTKKLDDFRHLLLNEGEIVLAMDRPLIAAGLKIARIRAQDLPCLLVQRVARFRPLLEQMTPFLFMAMNTVGFVRHLLGGQTGTQLPHISGEGIQSFPVALPPPDEQTRIVNEVDRRLSVIEELEAAVSDNLRRAGRLRGSILHRAFSN